MADIPIEGKVKPLLQNGRVADAVDVETTSSNVQQELTTIASQISTLQGTGRIGFAWLYESTPTATPSNQHFSFSSTTAASVNTIYFDDPGLDGFEINEILTNFQTGGYIFAQDTVQVNNWFLFRTRGPITFDGSRFTVPVTFLRSAVTIISSTDNVRYVFQFIPVSAVAPSTRQPGVLQISTRTVNATSPATFASSLTGITPIQGDLFRLIAGGEPFAGQTINAQTGDALLAIGATPSLTNVDDWVLIDRDSAFSLTMAEVQFLEQVTETSTTVEEADASDPSEASFVRLWLRDNDVQPGDVNNVGTGLRIDEAQSTLTQTTGQFNGRLYLALPTPYVDSTGTANLSVIVENPNGDIEQNLPLSTAFNLDSPLSAVVAGNLYVLTGGARGGFLGFSANQRVRVIRTGSRNKFTLSTDVSVNANVVDLSESALDPTALGKLNKQIALGAQRRTLLDAFGSTGSTAVLDGATEMLVKPGGPSLILANYSTRTIADGIPADTAGVSDWTVVVADTVLIESIAGSESGTATSITEISPSLIAGRRMYSVVLPAAGTSTNVFVPVGTTASFSRFEPSSIVKVGRENLDDALLQDFNRAHEELSEQLADFDSHLTVRHITGSTWSDAANPVQHRGTIARLFAAFWDESRVGATPFTGNYFEDLADPTIAQTNGGAFFFSDPDDIGNTDFPGRSSYFTGRLDVSGAPLTNSFKKIIAFSHYIRNDDFQADIPLLKAGTRRILGIGPTGLHVRRGNLDGAPVTATFNQRLFGTGDAFSIQYLRGVGANSIDYDVPENNPSGDAISFPLALTLRPKLVEGGDAGTQATVAYTITDRDTNQAESTVVVALNVPGTATTRDETLKLSYNGTTHVLNIATDGISTNTTADVAQIGFEVTYGDSQQVNSSITNTDIAFATQDEHRQRTVDIVLLIEATNPNETTADKQLTIKAVVNGHQENNFDLRVRESAFDFSDIQFGPNTTDQISISNIQIYSYDDSGDPFNTPTHADLYRFYQRRQQWLGLFDSSAEDYREYDVDGGMILTREDGTKLNLVEGGVSARDLDQDLRDTLRRAANPLPEPLDDLANHLTVSSVAGAAWTVPSNPTQHNGTITRLFAAWWDENRVGASPFTGNYFSDLTDPTLVLTGNSYFFTETDASGPSNSRFPGKQSFFTGKFDIDAGPLTSSFQKIIAFSHHIAHQLPTTDTPLLRLGTREVIGVDSQGLYWLQGNQDGALITATSNERLPITGTGFAPGVSTGDTIAYLRGVGAAQVQFDAIATTFRGNTVAYPLAVTLRIKRLQAGSTTTEVTAAYTITDREADQAETSQVVSIPTVPSGSADETLKLSYNSTTHVLTIATDGISTNGTADVSQLLIEATFNDSHEINDSTSVTKRRFSTQHDQVGNTVDMVIQFEAVNPFETSADRLMEMKVVIDGYQENNDAFHLRASAYDFTNVVIGPDSGENVAFANIQIYAWDDGGNPFFAPTHADLYRYYQARDRWFGLFLAPENSYLRFTFDGNIFITDQSGSTINLVQTLGTRSQQVFQAASTASLVAQVDLPADYTNFDYVEVVQFISGSPNEWRSMTIPVLLLTSGDVGATDHIRISGNTDVTWAPTPNRRLTDSGAAANIYRVALIKT